VAPAGGSVVCAAPGNLLTGQFPAAHPKGLKGRCTVHWGPEHQARLLVPVIAKTDA
jgi:uncharacterized protein